MKQMKVRAISLLIVCAFFLFGMSVFGFEYVKSGTDWGLYPANTHLFKNGQLNRAGAITDRDGTVLVSTKNGGRVYNSNRSIRKATLHSIGDLDNHIETGLQTSYLSSLCGFSLFDGSFHHSNEGNDIKMTLSSKVCADALSALGNKSGTVGVYNYKTGEMVCMVSTPTYDINDKEDSAKAKNGEYKGVYLNRFISADYTPGSTFKIITAAAGIDNFDDIYEREYTCNGGVEIDGEWVSCMGNHGKIKLNQAFTSSCNAYFSQLAVDLGQDTMTKYAEKAGFNDSFDIDGIKAKTSYFNVDNTRNIDLAWAGMGQYTNMMNPLQYLTMLGGIANGGSAKKPYFIDSITTPKGLPATLNLVRGSYSVFNSSTSQGVSELMSYAVKNNYGEWKFNGFDVCAKSGTAEVGEGRIPHSVFVGFTRNEDYPLAFVVVAENSGAGSGLACDIASSVLASVKKNVVF